MKVDKNFNLPQKNFNAGLLHIVEIFYAYISIIPKIRQYNSEIIQYTVLMANYRI